MKPLYRLEMLAIFICLIGLLVACSSTTAINDSQPSPETAVIQLPTQTTPAQPEKVVSLGTAAPTQPIEAEATVEEKSPLPSAMGGYLIFDGQSGAFKACQADGSLAYTIPAAGVKYPSGSTTQVVDGAVYYLPEKSEQFVRATPDGVKVIDFPANFMSKIAVTPDEEYIAWSIFDTTDSSSSLWVAQLDEEQNVLEPREIARYSARQSEAFSLAPIEWTHNGLLLFERGLTGIGGYILYGGHNSLYSYDPISEAIVTIVPAEEFHGLCLESYRPELGKVLFNCSRDGSEIVIRDLSNNFMEQKVPQLPEQGVAGSAHFSPSGQQLAYAIARRNPDDESGEVVVVPADLSAPPLQIAGVANNTFPAVHGWLDEETLLFSQTQWPNSILWSVRQDGSDLKEMGSGMFLGWIR